MVKRFGKGKRVLHLDNADNDFSGASFEQGQESAFTGENKIAGKKEKDLH
jgi:hypothetical protein